MEIVELVQNSEEWKRFRLGKIGGSTAPIIMGVSPYMTPRQLWQCMLGLREWPDFNNPATRRGHEVEPVARARYNIKYERNLQPVVFKSQEYPWAMASLDGFEIAEERIIWECKVVGREVFDLAKTGIVHEQYVPQLEHQLWVAKADVVHFNCVLAEQDEYGKWAITDEAIVKYRSNKAYLERLIQTETEFMERIQTQTEPPLTDRDTLLRTEADVIEVYREMRGLKEQIDELEAKITKLKGVLDPLKARAIQMMKHSREECQGLTLTKQVSFRVDETKLKDLGVSEQAKSPVVSYVLRKRAN
ncbi:MAG: YqaJ viral recombinase family protein [Bdellovibrionaceae bacterium]|nr:YqaJ viral recombinase family protein [Pseudobdellovibrionaceae bacterium]